MFRTAPVPVVCSALALAAAPALAPAARDRNHRNDDDTPLYPVITEVYFNVVQGDAGDASGDGTRHATGDEFIELWNPYEEEITLTGLTLVSRLAWHADSEDDKTGVRFTFPRFTLEADEVVVVFNGSGTRVPGNVGTPRRAHKKTNDRFADAWVFEMSLDNKNRSFNNSGDFVLLLDKDGEPIEGVIWGNPDPPAPDTWTENDEGETVERYVLREADKTPDGSVQRVLNDRRELAGFTNTIDFAGDHFTPGTIVEEADRPKDETAEES